MKFTFLYPNPSTSLPNDVGHWMPGWMTSFNFTVMAAILMTMALIPGSAPLVLAQANEEKVVEAWQLRNTGSTDEAKTLLENVLQAEPGNALANFEMARLLESVNPMGTEQIVAHCVSAMKSEPGNPYYAFYRARIGALEAYIAMHQGDQEVISRLVATTCDLYRDVIELDPGCLEARLYLVDFYSALPPEMGGNPEKARMVAEELAGLDKFAAARADLMLEGDAAVPTDHWAKYMKQYGPSAEAMKLLGKAYLMEDDIESAEEWFDKVIETYPGNQELYLDLARACIFRVMQGGESTDQNLENARMYMQQYLDGEFEKPVCTEAWCYGLLSRVEMFMEDKEASERSLQKANEMCPTFSRAMAVPSSDAVPTDPGYTYSSFFRPF